MCMINYLNFELYRIKNIINIFCVKLFGVLIMYVKILLILKKIFIFICICIILRRNYSIIKLYNLFIR